jgi:transcriptional regulator with XRE-family HTH domain
MAKRRTDKISDQLRQIIDDCGLSRYEIFKRTGIDQSTLAKFYNGQQGLSMNALDALGECLGLTVNMRRKPKQTRR